MRLSFVNKGFEKIELIELDFYNLLGSLFRELSADLKSRNNIPNFIKY